MENPCKPNIEEKHYNYSRIAETNHKNDTSKPELQNVGCPRKGFFGLGKPQDEAPPAILVSELLKNYL